MTTPSVEVLAERVGRHRNDIGRAFKHIKALEERKAEDDLHQVRDEAWKEEMEASLNSLNSSVEKVVEEFRGAANTMGDQFKLIIEEALEKELTPIKERITRIEEKEVDIVKVIRWLGTWRGVFFMCFVFAILIGVVAPDARSFILEALSTVRKAGG